MNPLAVYIHIPFCVVKCGYCDFNAYAGMDVLKPRYGEALLNEIASWQDVLGCSEVASISFGGGTPGEFPAEGIAAVIDAISASAGATLPDAEVSLEANPGTVSEPELARLVAGGVNRISFGAQSFDSAELRFLDRIHSPQAIDASVAAARRVGFGSVGLDLIFGLPGQTLDDWRRNLDRALETGVDHLSCYALTVEEGTPLARRIASGVVDTPDPDIAADMYEAAESRLREAGFRHYEISNWAREGHESRHNKVYWTGGEYLGIGAGAHGYLDGERYENAAHPREYIERLAVDSAGLPVARRAIASSYRPAETVALVDWVETRLRLAEGFDVAELRARFSASLVEAVEPVLSECRGHGLLEGEGVAPGRVRLTARGRLLHSEVCAKVLARLS